MNPKTSKIDISVLKRSNTELKKALQYFIGIAPQSGPLAAQIDNISQALKANEAMYTFSSLVDQYAKLKKNLDSLDFQSETRDLKNLKANLKKLTTKALLPEQLDNIEDVITDINEKMPTHSILVKLTDIIDGYGEAVTVLRQQASINTEQQFKDESAPNLIAADIQLASRKLLKDVLIVTKELTKTYPTDGTISAIIEDAEKILNKKESFFDSINLLEQTASYLALLIQQERCAAEEMLHDIHATLINVVNQTAIVEKVASSSALSTDETTQSMISELSNMEAKAKNITSIDEMQEHIKKSVSLMSDMMNEYAETQQNIQRENEKQISVLTEKLHNTTSFVEKLEQRLNVAEETNLVDELTTVGNRKGYVDRINKERIKHAETRSPLSVLLIDIDNFKSINDNFGHSIGDQVLKSFGKTLRKHIRSTDYVARYGGEEFVIILPDTDLDQASNISQKLRYVINSLKFELRRQNKALKITASFGLAQFTELFANSTEVFNQADKALYHAKENGKNCVAIAHGEELTLIKKVES